MFTNPSTPNLTDYLTFIRNAMGITPSNLPDNSPYITWSFDIAMGVTNQFIGLINPYIYTLAVYNYAADNLINTAPDQTNKTFFADARKSYGCNSFSAGVVQSAGDSSTSETLSVPASLSNLTLSDLQNLKTPYGRQYLTYAQMTGTLWGLS